MIKPFQPIQILSLLLIGILLYPGVKAAVVTQSLTWAYILLLSFGLASALVPTIRWFAQQVGAVDAPGGRKTHQGITPRLGGAAIFLGFALVMFLAQDIIYFTQQHKGVALGATLIFLIGVLDDIWGLTAKIRLLSQVLAVGILIKYGAILSFLPDVWWGHVGEYVITFLWVVGITNAINFLDGMDGLASGTAAINATFFSLVALRTDGSEMLLLAIALVGSCLGFLPFNFRHHKPASIFLGDSGSNFLGFTLAGIGILGEWGQDSWVGLVVPIVILGVPIFDTSLTTVVRIATGKVKSFGQWLHYAGRDHFHHRLSDLGLGNKRAVWVIYLISAGQGLEALVLKNARGVDALFSILQVGLAYFLMGAFMVFIHNRYIRLMEIRRNTANEPEK